MQQQVADRVAVRIRTPPQVVGRQRANDRVNALTDALEVLTEALRDVRGESARGIHRWRLNRPPRGSGGT
jgi:hypothetical protein